MKKENKFLLLLVLFCLLVVMVIELTSPTSLYRDPYMFRHFNAAEFILEKGRLNVIEQDLSEFNFVGWKMFYNKLRFSLISKVYLFTGQLVFFPVPVLFGAISSLLSGLDIYFLFNHFYFLVFISALSSFVLFREIFNDNKIALGIALIVVLFPFESLYYKITIHGWHFVRIFSSISLYFMVKLIKSGFSLKSKYFFLMLVFAFLGVYSDKSGFALVLIPLVSFFLVFFFFQKKEFLPKKRLLNVVLLVFFFLLFFSASRLFYELFNILHGIIYNLSNFNFIPSFIQPNMPYSEFYLQKDFWYILLKYLFPFLAVFALLVLNFNRIKQFVSKDTTAKAFVFSQAVFYFFVAVPMLFSFFFVSSSGATFIFFFLCWLSFIGLIKMNKSRLQYFLISLFFIFVLIVPLLYYTQAPQFKHEQFNEKHQASINWIQDNLENSIIYSDVKMAKAVSLEAGVIAVNPINEFNYSMKENIIPVYFSNDTNKVLAAFKNYSITHLLLTKEMSSLMVQPANELLKPATSLEKFDYSSNFDKLFENKQVRIYKIDYN